MKKVVRLTESDLNRLVRRIINEQPIPVPPPIPRPIQGPGPAMDLPKCDRFMKSKGGSMPTPGDVRVMSGPIDFITSTPPSPEMGYIVHKDGRPFCFIPQR